MKKLILGLTMAATLLLFAGCDKDTLSDNPAAGKKPHVTGTEKTGTSFSLATGSTCGGSICGAVESGSTSKYNSISITGTSSTLRYTLYERTTAGMGFDIYTPFAQFTCGDVTYAGGLVNNGAKVLVYATFTTDTPNATPGAGNVVQTGPNTIIGQISGSTVHEIVVGNNKGQSCGGNPNG